MAAMAIFVGVCVAGMLMLLWFLFKWFQQSSVVGGSYLLKLGVRRSKAEVPQTIAAAASQGTSTRAA